MTNEQASPEIDPIEFLRRALAINSDEAAAVREDAAKRTAQDERAERQFVVKATPWVHGYEPDIVGVGVTQTHDEDGTSAEDMVRDYLHLTFDRPTDSLRVRIEYRDSRA